MSELKKVNLQAKAKAKAARTAEEIAKIEAAHAIHLAAAYAEFAASMESVCKTIEDKQ